MAFRGTDVRFGIEKLTVENHKYYRKVLYTDKTLQLVIMSVPAGDEIEREIHPVTSQFIRVEEGKAQVTLFFGDEEKRFYLKDGDAIIIPANTEHQVINQSNEESLQLYTIYSPPVHKDQTKERN